MCGRFTLRSPAVVLADHFDVAIEGELAPRYNIAPTQLVSAVRKGSTDDARRFVALRWGLVPHWAKDVSVGNRMINARAETVAQKPAFRTAFRRRRCLIPADGYFEWQKRGKTKQPYYFRMQDDSPLAFAGLWESWRGEADQQAVESCTIITTEANALTRPIHDRMPVILEPACYDVWLDAAVDNIEALLPLLRPLPADAMTADPVSTHVNSPRNDDPRCIEVVKELF
jgi:putative SOS response-associated peptidase YedK